VHLVGFHYKKGVWLVGLFGYLLGVSGAFGDAVG